MMGNEPEAEDALQESFIDVFRHLEAYRGESSLGSWIKRIVINHCINQLKRRKIAFEELQEYHHHISDVEEEDHGTYNVKLVRDAIMKLPDGYRQVLTLYLIEGYDHSEISSILGIGEAGSKSQYSRAKSRLRELLKEKVVL